MNEAQRRLLRYSLGFVWLLTAAVSVWELHGQSRALLAQGGVDSDTLASTVILAGAAVDLVLGLLICLRPLRTVYALALLGMLAMTVVATVLLPNLWLHPLGPLSKNVPIAVVLWLLLKDGR